MNKPTKLVLSILLASLLLTIAVVLLIEQRESLIMYTSAFAGGMVLANTLIQMKKL